MQNLLVKPEFYQIRLGIIYSNDGYPVEMTLLYDESDKGIKAQEEYYDMIYRIDVPKIRGFLK